MKRGDEEQDWEEQPQEGGRYLATPNAHRLAPIGPASLALASQFDEAAPQREINLLAYWHVLVKHRLVIAGAVTVMLMLGLMSTLMTTPVYRAKVLMQIDRTSTKVVDMEDVVPEESRDAEFYQTQYTLLKSRSLAERVVKREGLADDPTFMNQQRQTPVSYVRRLFGGDGGNAAAGTPAVRERRAAGMLAAGLTVEPVRSSRLVRIGYDSPDPEVAARVVNAVAENFIGANLDRRFDASSYARKFLEERLAQVKGKLEDSERQLVAYAANQQILNVAPTNMAPGGATETASQSLTASDLVSMNSALGAAKGERVRAEQRWRQASLSGMSMPEILASATIQSLRQSRSALAAQYQEKLSVYKPDFPAMVQLKAQIDETDRQIAEEANTIRQSIYAQYQVALKQEASLAGQVSSLKSDVLDLRSRSIQYNILQREVDTNRALYDGLLQRYKEIGVSGGVGANNVSVVDPAERPSRPYKPNMLLNLAIAAGIGLMAGVLAAFGLESLDETIKVPEDVEGKLGIPLLGAIPMLEKGMTPEEALADPRSAFSEAYYSVRTALQFSTDEGVPAHLLVTSTRPSEGKSTTAVALARNFARLGMTVLLVDADLRNPSLHRSMHCDNSAGLSNYLTGSATLASLVQVTDQPNLAFMPCGPLPPNPAELLASARVRTLTKDASAVFDLLIIDGPPVMGLADAPLLASHVTGTLLVIEAGSTRQGPAKAAAARLKLGRARVLGALLNKFSVKSAGYGYGYGYGYSYDYDYGAKKLPSKA